MMKRLLASLMAAVLVVSMLPGCGKDGETEKPRTLLAASTVTSSGVSMRAKQGSATLDITRAQPGGTAPSDLKDGTWTVFVYLCGSDLESDDGSATNDLAEMVGASGSENVSFVVQTGGAKKWNYGDLDGDKTQRLLIQDGSIMEVDSFGETDMGEANTLADFLTWGVKEYPAKHMGVILWNHGGGSLSGVCFDERNDDDSLVLRELDAALSETFEHMWDKFEFVGFDACLMGTIETANVLATYANYQYGSEEWEPGTGWDYSTIMESLARDPNISGDKLGKVVSDSYFESLDKQDRDTATFSVVDLSRVDALLQSFNATSKELFEATENADALASVVRAIADVDNFGGNNWAEGYTNMVDLGGILQAASDVAPSAASTLGLLDDVVVYHKNGKTHKAARGLSVYYPLQIQDSAEMTLFEQVCVSPYYLSFVDRQTRGGVYGTEAEQNYDESTWFSGGFWEWLLSDDESGESLASAQDDSYWNYVDEHSDESTLITFADKPQFDKDGIYWFRLDKDGLKNSAVVSACVYMMSEDEQDLLALGETYDVDGSWDDGTFYDMFDGYWLSLPDGQNLCTYVADSADDYVVYACPITLNGEETNLRVRVYYDDYSTMVEGAWDGVSETGGSQRGITKIKKGDVIVPLYDAFALEGDDELTYTGQKYKVGKDFEVAYDYLDPGVYFYEFAITDIYGDTYFSDPVEFDIDEKGEVTYFE